MSWQSSTATAVIVGSSTMSASSALSRAWTAIPASVRITGFTMNWQLAAGASGSTYNTFAAGVFSRTPNWAFGISYVASGGTVPNLFSATDDTQFLWVGGYNPYADRNTINTAGSPAYADLYQYGGSHSARLQLDSGVGGDLYMHVANLHTGSQTTFWEATVRASYHA